MGDYPFGGIGSLQRQAATADAGFALQNGTSTIISWTVPNDGHVHRVKIFAVLSVSVQEVGGTISEIVNTPDGNQQFVTLIQGNLAATQYSQGQGGSAWTDTLVQPGTTVSIRQFSALTGGAAVLWAEIWGS